MQLKPITAIVVLLLVVVSLLVTGCTSSTTSNTNQTSSETSGTATQNATTTTTSVVSTSTATPTANPLQCYHVDIIIYHNTSTPCNTCAQTIGTLQPIYANNSYWSIHIENVNDQNGSGNRMIGTIRETGETTTFAWGDTAAIRAWSDAHLLCY
jgi:CxxC motif-containing protein (DUF1111 family)